MSQNQDTVSLPDLSIKNYTSHRNRSINYSLQLTGYTQMIRQVSTMAVLDANMVVLLEALTDLLADSKFARFQRANEDEADFNGHDVRMVITCRFCNWNAPNALQLLLHLMNEIHSRRSKKYLRMHLNASPNYQMFMAQECVILEKHGFPPAALACILDFYFVTNSFLRMTSRYLKSLHVLECHPSTIIASGVSELLTQIDTLVSTARCVESISEYNSQLMTHRSWDIRFLFENNIYESTVQIMEKMEFNKGMDNIHALRNIFSLPSTRFNVLPPARYLGPGLMMNEPTSNVSNQQSLPQNIAPFRTLPPLRMIPPPASQPQMHRMYTPILPLLGSVPHIQPIRMNLANSTNNAPLQNGVQQIYNSNQHHLPGPCQQPSPQQQPPAFRPQAMLNSLPPMFDASQLPPLIMNNPIFDEQFKRFLKEPNLEDLIENGNILRDFQSSSLIPSEICLALKVVAPDVKVSCFGAKVSGVGYEEDHLNLFVNDGTQTKTIAFIEVLFTKLCEFFETNSDDWMIENKDLSGLDSNLTVKNHCENVCCRISFDSEIYYCNSQLIQYYMRTFPVAQKLCYYVQEFTKLVDLNFTRYLIIVLVVFFLQIRGCLPTVDQLQANMLEQKMHHGWLINFTPKQRTELKVKDCESDLRKCATDFFNFYGNQFSFADSVVCPQEGMAVNRADFTLTNEWRMPLKRYRAYLETVRAAKNETDDLLPCFNAMAPMCVQDLLQLTMNVAGTVSLQDTNRFVRFCRMAYQHYNNNQ
ncbi:uncharacterized protein LOC131691042 [Topomyia yanbarensis]|uniref:uncharacterized protein LOC131691042 n=1 Tax=Topomyia yanbarensis TaxID=2498891 RepID=UPI00273B6F3F|nr:uncharacterized protein LOC131691042 [Topomyia yanbarensis]XP_058833175.1 uncharacterized protein LOC131691042 [Topomyia yanbarensis]